MLAKLQGFCGFARPRVCAGLCTAASWLRSGEVPETACCFGAAMWLRSQRDGRKTTPSNATGHEQR